MVGHSVSVTFNTKLFKNGKYALRLTDICLVCLGVGDAGPGRFREVGRDSSHVCAGLGEKFQGPQGQRERVRTPPQVHVTTTDLIN